MYDVAVHMSKHPDLNAYVSDSVALCRTLLRSGSLERLLVVVAGGRLGGQLWVQGAIWSRAKLLSMVRPGREATCRHGVRDRERVGWGDGWRERTQSCRAARRENSRAAVTAPSGVDKTG